MTTHTLTVDSHNVTWHDRLVKFFEVWRKPISFMVAALFLVLLFLSDAPHPLGLHIAYDVAGVALIALAALGRVWCAIYIAGHKNSQLTVDGPYSLTRNPLYVLSFLGLVGVCLFAHLMMLAVISALVFLFYYHFVICAEENRLAKLVSKDYSAYQTRTPRFWPNFSLYHSRERFSIEPKRLLRAMSEVVWFLLAIAGLEFIEMLHDSGVVPILFNWMF